MRRRPARLEAAAVALALAAGLVLAGSCGPEVHKSELVYVVRGPDGAPLDGSAVDRVAGTLDVMLLEAGYERRSVLKMGPDRVRVVLPENVAHELPKVRKLLESYGDGGVSLELVERPVGDD